MEYILVTRIYICASISITYFKTILTLDINYIFLLTISSCCLYSHLLNNIVFMYK